MVHPMVERIARVLSKCNGVMDDGVEEHWANFTRDATMVLESMVGATDDMKDAGCLHVHGGSVEVGATWDAMVRSALS